VDAVLGILAEQSQEPNLKIDARKISFPQVGLTVNTEFQDSFIKYTHVWNMGGIFPQIFVKTVRK
jgi:hypothetical protein